MEYAEKFKDPRWQKKRLEVLEANGWECQNCGGNTNMLHVHHKIYVKGKEPWEYEVDELACLCEGCHNFEHEIMDLIKNSIKELDISGKRTIVGYLARLTGHVSVISELGYEELIGFFQANTDTINEVEAYIESKVKRK